MGLAGLSIAMLGASANAEIESEFGAGYHTDYIFRGFDVGENLFDFSLDFSGSCDCGLDWNAGVWFANWSSPNFEDYEDELNIYGGVSKDLGVATVEAGFIRYIFIDDDDSGNTEIYLRGSTSFNVVDLGATFYWNVDADEFSSTNTGAWYLELDATYGFDLSDSLSGEVGLGVAFFDDNESGGESGLANYSAHVSLTKQLSDCLSISPYVQVVVNDDDYNEDDDGDGEEYIVGGIRTTFKF